MDTGHSSPGAIACLDPEVAPMKGAILECPDAPASAAVVGVVLSLLCFVSAFLVVFVQPVVVSALLPHSGANPLLWHGLQTLFQLFLLVGYLLALGLSGSRTLHWYAMYSATAALAGVYLATALATPIRVGTQVSLIDSIWLVTGWIALPACAVSTGTVVAQDIYWLTGRGPTGSLLPVISAALWRWCSTPPSSRLHRM
jgi:hypothetical protein